MPPVCLTQQVVTWWNKTERTLAVLRRISVPKKDARVALQAARVCQGGRRDVCVQTGPRRTCLKEFSDTVKLSSIAHLAQLNLWAACSAVLGDACNSDIRTSPASLPPRGCCIWNHWTKMSPLVRTYQWYAGIKSAVALFHPDSWDSHSLNTVGRPRRNSCQYVA